MGPIIVLVVVALLVVFAIGVFNNIVSLENRVANALGQIDVQLKKRSDLVPNLVSTVKGYAAHETSVFEKVTEARSKLDNASGIEDKAAAFANSSTDKPRATRHSRIRAAIFAANTVTLGCSFIAHVLLTNPATRRASDRQTSMSLSVRGRKIQRKKDADFQ